VTRVPFFKVPLNLPHAGTISTRIQFHLSKATADAEANEKAARIVGLLVPYTLSGENPSREEAAPVIVDVTALARALVDDIERLKAGHDRLGQAVRNLFECLELGEEGATISLRAGENPESALRPI
jgi:hypothetical protein